jgi:hypothetical protein
MVRCCHEPWLGWVAKDGIVRQCDVGNVKVEALCPIVVPGSEGDGRRTCPIGVVDPSVTPKNGRVGMSRWYGTCIFSKISTEMMLRPAPPSMRVRLTAMLLMVGMHKRGIVPTPLGEAGWSSSSKPILQVDHFIKRLPMLGCAAMISHDSCLK